MIARPMASGAAFLAAVDAPPVTDSRRRHRLERAASEHGRPRRERAAASKPCTGAGSPPAAEAQWLTSGLVDSSCKDTVDERKGAHELEEEHLREHDGVTRHTRAGRPSAGGGTGRRHLEGVGEGEGARRCEGRLVHGRRQRELECERPEDGAQHLRDAVACVSLLAQAAARARARRGSRVSYGRTRCAPRAWRAAAIRHSLRRQRVRGGGARVWHRPVTTNAVEIAGLRWPPLMPAVAYTSTTKASPLPMAAVASPAPGDRARAPSARAPAGGRRAHGAARPGRARGGSGSGSGGGTCGDGVGIRAAADELEQEDADKLGDDAVDGDLACGGSGGAAEQRATAAQPHDRAGAASSEPSGQPLHAPRSGKASAVRWRALHARRGRATPRAPSSDMASPVLRRTRAAPACLRLLERYAIGIFFSSETRASF